MSKRDPRPIEDNVVGPSREDVEPFTTHGVAPEARADLVPAEADIGRVRSDPSNDPGRSDRATERGAAVPGIGGAEAPPPAYGETPGIRLKRPLATRPSEPEVGRRPVPRDDAEEGPSD